MTTPVPSGITTFTMGQVKVSAPEPTIAFATFATCSIAVFARFACAAGPPGVPAAAVAAACAAAIAVVADATVAESAAAPAADIPRHAGCPPIMTLLLPGPGASGHPCAVGSPTRAAGPFGISAHLARLERLRG